MGVAHTNTASDLYSTLVPIRMIAASSEDHHSVTTHHSMAQPGSSQSSFRYASDPTYAKGFLESMARAPTSYVHLGEDYPANSNAPQLYYRTF